MAAPLPLRCRANPGQKVNGELLGARSSINKHQVERSQALTLALPHASERPVRALGGQGVITQ